LTKSISDTDAGILVQAQYTKTQPKDLLLVFTGEGVNERALELYACACENLPMVRNAFPRPRTIEKIRGRFRGEVKLHLAEAPDPVEILKIRDGASKIKLAISTVAA
jgi:hypothetical protein